VPSRASVLLVLVACGGPPNAPRQLPRPLPVVARSYRPLPTEFAGHDWRDAVAAPLDVNEWIDERDCAARRWCPRVAAAPGPLPRPKPTLVRTHRLSGPRDLDGDIAALDVDVRACFRSADAVPRIKVTIRTSKFAPPVVIVEPADLPTGFRLCVADVMRGIGSVASSPVVVVAGAPF
jgi:hypothetical protein